MKTLSIEELLKEIAALKRIVAEQAAIILELQARLADLEKQGKKNSRK